MAFSDPQTITISAVPHTLPKVSSGEYMGKYENADGTVDLTASHALGRRTRRVLRLDHAKITADPFIPTQNAEVSMSTYMVFDIPKVGYSNADVKAIYVGFNTLYTASSHALIDKVLGGES